MTLLELKLHLPDDLWAYLQNQALTRDMPLEAVVVDMLRDQMEEPTEEQILANIREGMLDAFSGNVSPAHEFLDALERGDYDDES